MTVGSHLCLNRMAQKPALTMSPSSAQRYFLIQRPQVLARLTLAPSPQLGKPSNAKSSTLG